MHCSGEIEKYNPLTDDTYLGKVASQEGVKNVYDLKSVLEANIIEGEIENRKVGRNY